MYICNITVKVVFHIMSQGFSYHCKMVFISQVKVCERVLMVSYLLPWHITWAIHYCFSQVIFPNIHLNHYNKIIERVLQLRAVCFLEATKLDSYCKGWKAIAMKPTTLIACSENKKKNRKKKLLECCLAKKW